MFGLIIATILVDAYITESAANNNFVIRVREREDHSLTSLPSVFWTFLRTDEAFKNVQHGPTVGLGVTVGDSGSRPAVFVGYAVRYNQNVGVAAGVTAYPHRRLDSKYMVNQTITENLDTS